MILTPRDWASFQHYKNRSPAWIKLHRGLLDDYAFSRLPLASRALAPMLWLLASEYEDGKITASVEEMAYRFRTNEKDLVEALNPLIKSGFFESDSNVLAQCKQDACLEERRGEEEKRENILPGLDQKAPVPVMYPPEFELKFWRPYPRTQNMSKKEAWDVWRKMSREDRLKAIAAVPKYAAFLKSKPDHPAIHACRFLSKRRFDGFEDEERPSGEISAIVIPRGSDRWRAWWEHFGPNSFGRTLMQRAIDTATEFQQRTEWPPGYVPRSEAAE